MNNIVAQVTDHVTQFHCSVSPHYTQLGVKIVSLCVSFACKHVFLYQIFPTNKPLSQTMYLLIFQQTSLGILETCQLTGYLARENPSPICSKFSGKMSHQR